MTGLTRRAVLAGAGAVAVAGVPGAVQGEDAALLALCAEWHRLQDIYGPLWTEAKRVRAEADADPNCPDLGNDELIYAHWERFGWNDLYDRATVLDNKGLEVAERLFDEPVHTSRGALEKIRVVLRIEAERDDPDAYPPYDEFAEILQADFERLIAGMRP